MLLPHVYLSTATRLDADYLRSQGIDGLLLDIDGTLKDFLAPSIPPNVIAWLERLREHGIGLCLFSNGRVARIEKLASALGLPFVAEAMKPSPTGCRRGLKILGLTAQRVAVVGDQIYADVLAGRLAGLHTVLVQPTSRVEPWFTRLKRPFEAPLLWLIRRRLDVYQSPRRDAAAYAAGRTPTGSQERPARHEAASVP
jgi:HAD superfamily phosphatase (TIGR01668 family)